MVYMGKLFSYLYHLSEEKWFNTSRRRQNDRHFLDDIFKRIFFNENVCILLKISLKFVPKGPVNNIPALVQKMVWRRPGYWCLDPFPFVARSSAATVYVGWTTGHCYSSVHEKQYQLPMHPNVDKWQKMQIYFLFPQYNSVHHFVFPETTHCRKG